MRAVDESTLSQYRKNGFLVVDEVLLPSELETLRSRMTEVSTGRVPSFPAANIEFEPGSSVARKINQCAQHDEVFMAHASHPRILDIVETLIGSDIKLFGSQCFMKPPGGVEKPYHQDSAYFTIEPPEIVTCWTALDDATIDNGCLWVIPGSHLGKLLDHDQPWQVGDRIDMQVRDEQIDFRLEVPNELAAGSCSFHHSMLLHRSGPNQTDRPRRGLAVHYMSSRSRWTNPSVRKPDYLLLRGVEYEGCV